MTTIIQPSTVTQLWCSNNSREAHKTAVVSGQSVVGMLAAMVLAKAGYLVDCFEIRKDYTRNIQWAVRQSLVDQLASIDEKMAGIFIQEVVTPIEQGSIHIYPSGKKRAKSHDSLIDGEASNIPSTCKEMMNLPSGGIVEAKTFEKFLKRYLVSMQGIRLHNENATKT